MAEIEKVYFVKDNSNPIGEELPKILWYLATMGIPVFSKFSNFTKKIEAFTVNRKEAAQLGYSMINFGKGKKQTYENV